MNRMEWMITAIRTFLVIEKSCTNDGHNLNRWKNPGHRQLDQGNGIKLYVHDTDSFMYHGMVRVYEEEWTEDRTSIKGIKRAAAKDVGKRGGGTADERGTEMNGGKNCEQKRVQSNFLPPNMIRADIYIMGDKLFWEKGKKFRSEPGMF